jgi:two-component system, cell cycle response regulator CpdR
MEHTSRSSNDVTPWGYSSDADRLAAPAILLVEDDGDIRDMLVTLLEMAGFAVVPCDCAEVALDALREGEFDLVLTDYALPRHSGVWLLRTAEAEGLLQGTPALIVTAHPQIDADGIYEVIRKPFDLDELVERVRQHLEGDRGTRRRRPDVPPGDGDGSHGNASGGGPSGPGPVELILYVSGNSPKADAAVSTMRKVLERFNSPKVVLTVYPLPESANCVVADAVEQTGVPPRQNASAARTLILGHITNPELLLELLEDREPEL